MLVEWFGQSAFRLAGEGATVFIDPFGDMSAAAARGIEFGYRPIAGVEADLVLVTHEHRDHNAVEVVGGSPAVIRSTAGRLDSPVGTAVAVASEHDSAAGTERGPNTVFVFTLDGLRICHMGDLGQGELRLEQERAIGAIDVLFVPVGGGPTIGASEAREIVAALGPRLVVPMHYRTEAINFLEPPEEFLAQVHGRVERVPSSVIGVEELAGSSEDPVVALLEPPLP